MFLGQTPQSAIARQYINPSTVMGIGTIGYNTSPEQTVQIYCPHKRCKRAIEFLVLDLTALIGSLIRLAGSITYSAVPAKNITASMITIDTTNDRDSR